MKLVSEQRTDCGVIVGRFQVDSLTPPHIDLIQTVIDRHRKVIILLGTPGLTPVPSTHRNPLDFESRKQMISEQFPDIIISYVKDMKYDEDWSAQVDERITDLISPGQTVTLYGSRDSFIKYYSGKFKTEELEPTVYYSASECRRLIKSKAKSSADFRAGVIWANENRFKDAVAVVDIAIFYDKSYNKILLGRRFEDKGKYRLFGGFTDVDSDFCYEDVAAREAREESGLNVNTVKYIMSFKVDDWRFKNENNKVYTTLFSAIRESGSVVPGDDIDECRWFDLNKTKADLISFFCGINGVLVDEHKEPFEILLDKIYDI